MPTVTELRTHFAANHADALAKAVNGSLTRRAPERGWTSRAVWYDSADELMAVVGSQEGTDAEVAMSHGLYHCGGDRKLTLVLPGAFARSTRNRLAWITADVHVFVYDDGDLQPEPVSIPSRDGVLKHAGGGPDRSHALHLDDAASEWLRPITEWAAGQQMLDPTHRDNMRVWSCLGQRVLTIKNRSQPTITAGVDAVAEPALTMKVAGPLAEQQLDAVISAVRRGIDHAIDKKHGAFPEHKLQQHLRAAPYRLGLEHPILREVPAWRPGGGDELGRGFIDLVGLDSLGDVTLVETKLGPDDMLIFQGLDYWVWALRQQNRDWLVQRLHADPARARTRLLYAIGAKGDADPVLSRYCVAHLDALDPSVDWRIALVKRSGSAEDMQVKLLPRGSHDLSAGTYLPL